MEDANKRKILNEMQETMQGKKVDHPELCPACGKEFYYDVEAILFDKPITCPCCGKSFTLQQNKVPNALSSIASQIADMRKRNRKRNRKRGF